jgi:hypothetical protein
VSTDGVNAKAQDHVYPPGSQSTNACKSLIQLEIMPQPPLKRAANDPWPEWPEIKENRSFRSGIFEFS